MLLESVEGPGVGLGGASVHVVEVAAFVPLERGVVRAELLLQQLLFEADVGTNACHREVACYQY